MADRGSGERRFAFEVVVAARVTVAAVDARAARAVVDSALGGVTAGLTSGTGVGLELRGARVAAGTAALLTVDGVDPTAGLEALIRALRPD